MKHFFLPITIVFLIIFQLSCNNGENIKVGDIPLPKGTMESTENGAFENRYDLDVSKVKRILREDYKDINTNEKIIMVSDQTDWEAIVNHYNKHLSNQKYERDKEISENRTTYNLAVWKKKVILNEKAFAVLLTEDIGQQSNTKTKMLAVFTAE